nr:hypothetical protein [Tanacetum cinerariifolium]
MYYSLSPPKIRPPPASRRQKTFSAGFLRRNQKASSPFDLSDPLIHLPSHASPPSNRHLAATAAAILYTATTLHTTPLTPPPPLVTPLPMSTHRRCHSTPTTAATPLPYSTAAAVLLLVVFVWRLRTKLGVFVWVAATARKGAAVLQQGGCRTAATIRVFVWLLLHHEGAFGFGSAANKGCLFRGTAATIRGVCLLRF